MMNESPGYEKTLCRLFGVTPVEGEWPLGALSRYGAGYAAQGWWLRADPIHLQAGLTALSIVPGAAQDLSSAEAKTLIACFNAHFADRGLHLELSTPVHWHLHLMQPYALITCSLQQAVEGDLAACLPQGRQAAFWRAIFTEAQMLFHELEINQARADHGALPINALWFSGFGRLPEGIKAVLTGIWANDLVALGLARLAGIPVHPLPADLEAVLATDPEGQVLVGLSPEVQPHPALAFEALEQRWLAPIEDALRARRLARVVLYDAQGDEVILTPAGGLRRLMLRRRLTQMGRLITGRH